MTPRIAGNEWKRVLGALKLERSDRPPVCAFSTAVNLSMMSWAGEDFSSVLGSPERYAKLAAAPWEVYGIENLKIPFDMTVEPEIFGAGIDFGTATVLPQVRTHPFGGTDDFAVPPAWQDKGRVPFMRKVLAILRKRYGGHVPICHLCDGPFTLAGMLFGLENLAIWMAESPDAYNRAMDRVTGFCMEYCRMLKEAGVDVIQFGEASASGDLISGEQYARYVAPYHTRLADAVGMPSMMHICGRIDGHFPAIAGTGLSGISFDQKADPIKAIRYCKGRMALIGYVAIPVLNEGTPDQVRAAARECLAAGVDILHAGCAWPPTVPDANARAFVEEARSHRRDAGAPGESGI